MPFLKPRRIFLPLSVSGCLGSALDPRRLTAMRCRMGDMRAFFPERDEPTDRSRAPGTGIRSRRHWEPSRDGTSPEAAGGRRAEGTERPGWEGAGSGPAPSFVLLPGPLDFSGPLAVAVRSQCLFGEFFFFFPCFSPPPSPSLRTQRGAGVTLFIDGSPQAAVGTLFPSSR